MDNTNLAELFANLLFDEEKFKEFQNATKLYEEKLSEQIENDIKSAMEDLSVGEKKD